MRARGVVRITPADVGKRVSVRARTHAPPGQPSATDTVGVLLAWDDGILHIQRRDGSVSRVADADLLAARVVSPAPDRRRRE